MLSLWESISLEESNELLLTVGLCWPFASEGTKFIPNKDLPIPDMNVLFAAYLILVGTTIWVPTNTNPRA